MDFKVNENLLEQVIKIAKKAGNFIKNEQIRFDRKAIQLKAKNDLVSYVDIESEKIITTELLSIFPESGILGEESQNNRKGEWMWMIDPLDGTTNFSHGLPIYCVSIALTYFAEPLLGVVFDPQRDECFYSMKGKGAFLNGNPIKCSDVSEMAKCLVGTGFPTRDFSRRKEYLQALHDLMEKTQGVRRMGSAAIDLCYVACGRLDVFFEYNLSPWDVAAGALICMESGCVVSDFSGTQQWLFGKEIVAAPAMVYNEFANFIKFKFKHA
ncbi:MAG: inositol monophosphatase [Bacteroidia bacterium]|nr:inositol monophosphatase [Bacteroidia bacterium]